MLGHIVAQMSVSMSHMEVDVVEVKPAVQATDYHKDYHQDLAKSKQCTDMSDLLILCQRHHTRVFKNKFVLFAA